MDSRMKRKKKKRSSDKQRSRKKSLSDSFIRSFSYSSYETKKCTDYEDDRISLRSNKSSSEKRPISEPTFSSLNALETENKEEMQFWTTFLNGSYDLEPDSLVVQLDKGVRNTDKNPSTDKSSSQNFAKLLKKPSDDVVMTLPQPVVGMIQHRFELFEKSLLGLPNLDTEEVARGKFVILCETFLHMYNNIFGLLEEYLNSNDIWEMSNNGFNNMKDEYYADHYFSVSSFKSALD